MGKYSKVESDSSTLFEGLVLYAHVPTESHTIEEAEPNKYFYSVLPAARLGVKRLQNTKIMGFIRVRRHGWKADLVVSLKILTFCLKHEHFFLVENQNSGD